MHRTYTCILCPNGCEIAVEFEGKQILSLEGQRCAKGKGYVEQELIAPMRNIASLVAVEQGELPLTSVRLTQPIPKEQIFAVMAEIKRQKLTAPTRIGQVVIADVLGLGSDVIVTKPVARRE